LWSAWQWLFAPKGTSKDIIGKLGAARRRALAEAAVRSRLAEPGFEVFPREQQTSEGLAALQKWRPIIKAAGIKADIREQAVSMR
jgi:tripartite-type tricarboxylate transporter receptor subunit TctC